MGCVNISSKEFKSLAAKHNVDNNTMELIVHKYWLEKGNENEFPTDVYIQAQLGTSQYKELGTSVRKLWKKLYSTPKDFNTLMGVQQAVEEASQYFPKSAISYYQLANGKYRLSIKEPVAYVTNNESAFFKEYDKNGSPKGTKKYDLDIQEDKTYSIDKVQEIFNKFNTDRTNKDLARRVFNLIKDLDLKVSFNETLPLGIVGRAQNNNTITLRKSFFEGSTMDNEKASIILHEALHTLSMYALSEQTATWERPKDIEKFRTEMTSLFEDIKDNPILKDEKGVTNLYEFVAELSNPIFRDKLKQLDKEQQTKAKSEKKSFWHRLIDAFKTLLGLHPTNNYYQRSMNALDKAINSFDIDSYMRYNNLKNPLREGLNEGNWRYGSNSEGVLREAMENYFDSKLYEEDLLRMKKEAIANGTFMKAPNGKKSNLTERQWLQVRTKAFKDWFGDWETTNNLLTNLDKIDNSLVDVEQHYKPWKKDKTKGNNTLRIYLKDHSKGYFELVKDYEFGMYSVHFKTAREGGKYNSKAIISTKEDRKTLFKELIKLIPEGAQVSTWGEISEDGIKGLNNVGRDFIKVGEREITKKSDGSKVNIPIYQKGEGISKVVDENGEPLVVYHESPNKFTTFDTSKKRYNVHDVKGIWTSTIDRKGRGYGENIYPLFVNLRNPDYTDVHSTKNIIELRRVENEALQNPNNDGAILKTFDKSGFETQIYVKNPNQIKSATDNIGTFSRTNDEIYNYELTKARDFTKTIPYKDLTKELDLIKQESADYKLTSPNNQETKSFTFEDGISVEAPFTPNNQQAEALNKINEFIHSNNESMLLSGYAGTGKTSIMKMITEKCNSEGIPFSLCATTNKAASTLKKMTGIKATTVHRLFGIKNEINIYKALKTGKYNTRDTVNTLLPSSKVIPNSLIIIDESSMLSKEIYNIVKTEQKYKNAKVLFIGDPAQLPPVKENDTSIVFHDNSVPKIELTKVERTGDNAILEEATNLRKEGKTSLSGVSSFNNKGQGVAYIPSTNSNAINDVINYYTPGLKSDPSSFRILAFTNKAVTRYNRQVRKTLGYPVTIPQVGEPMMAYANLGYKKISPKESTYDIINSEAYTIAEVGEEYNKESPVLSDGSVVTLKARRLILKDAEGKEVPFDFIDIIDNEDNRKAATKVAKDKEILIQKKKGTSGRDTARILSKINALESVLGINDDIIGEDGDSVLSGKSMDYGYAMTVHKSQGTTISNVLIDDVDIARGLGNGISMQNVKMLSTDGKDVGDVDLGSIDYSNATSDNTPKENKTLMRKQLEYVAVTRATDTVTIIDNPINIKKEDTPLNHINDKKSSTPNNSNTREIIKDKDPMIRRMQENAEKMALTTDEKFYVDTTTGTEYTRVTTFIGATEDGERFDENSPYKIPSTNIGTGFDELGRSFIAGNIKKVNDEYMMNGVPVGEIFPNASSEQLNAYCAQWEAFKKDMEDKGYHFIPRDIMARGIEPIKDNKGLTHYINVAGTLDLLMYKEVNGKREYAIIDMKTKRSRNINPETISKWSKQLSLYKKLLEKEYGINIKELYILPTYVNPYPVDRYNLNANVYTVTATKPKEYPGKESNQLILNGKLYKDASPDLRPLISIQEMKNFNIVWDKLTDSEKEVVRESDQSISGQLINNLNNLGIKVGDSQSIQDYMSKHSLKDTTQLISQKGVDPFTASQGELYGFVDKEGNIYLDENSISPEHPIYEYTHLWDRVIQERNPELWQRGIDLMKETNLWNTILNNSRYGKKWQAEGITDKELENRVAAEVHSRYVGQDGLLLLDKQAQEKGKENIVSKLKQWFMDVWHTLKDTFSNWSNDDLDNLKLVDFNLLPLRDFAEGVDLSSNTSNVAITTNTNGEKTIQYTFGGKKHTYTIKGTHIYNSEGKEVFKDSPQNVTHRNKIFANLAVYENRAVIVEHHNRKYVVNNKDQIISVTSGKEMQWGKENGDRKAILESAKKEFEKKNIIKQNSQDSNQQVTSFTWATTSDNSYEVSTLASKNEMSKQEGDARFSAHNAKFNKGTIIDGVDVGGMTVEDVYQKIIKKSSKGKAPAKDSKLYNETLKTKEEREDFSYTEGYLPLWQEWARQNPELIEELRKNARGKILTDKYAYNTTVSQARALADILNSQSQSNTQKTINTNLNITPANDVDKKAAIKGAMANKFIGFADGIFNSSTGKYAQQAGDKANTGNYTSDDVVFVSIPGKRGNEDIRHQQQDRTIAEALKALRTGATLLTDNKAYTENSTYNEGEKRLAKALNDAGAIYSEIQKDKYIIGVWSINTILSFKPEEAEFYSGAANGSDKAWEEAATKAGIKVTNYTVENWDNLSNEWKEKLDKEYQEIVNTLGRKVLDITSYAGKLVRRDMMQADKADAIFAIGTLASNGYVDGGTGYATTRGIIRGIPVYLFDQADNTWKVWDKGEKKFISTPQPSLTKNAAVIGTRKLQNNGKEAINSLFTSITSSIQEQKNYEKAKEVHTETLKVLGSDNNAQQEIKDTMKSAVKGIPFEEALGTVQSIFNKEEINQIKTALNGKNLQVISVSRMTDPVFFTKEIIGFLKKNAEKPLTDPTRVDAIEIWSKHDGIPIQDLLRACKEYKVAPMVSFSITGLGGTALEKGVMKYNDLLDRIEKLIEAGDLNPTTTTIRIDPILVGVTNMKDIKAIIERAKSMGIKKFVTSLVQSYGYLEGTDRDRKVISGINNALASEGKSYDWDKYYGRITENDFIISSKFVNDYKSTHPNASWGEFISAGVAKGIRVVTKKSIGKIHFIPKQEYIKGIGKILLEFNRDPEIEIETCSFTIKGLKASTCLDPLILERVTGVDVTRKDGTYDRDTSRPDCMCYGAHSDIFRMNEKQCHSSCAYCYAGKSDNNNMNYYNEDGTLKQNNFTTVRSKEDISVTSPQDTTGTRISELPSDMGEAISLDKYEQLKSLPSESIKIKEQWKASKLQELNASISDNNYPEENRKILNKMDTLIDFSGTEEEYNKKYSNSEKKEMETTLNEYDKLVQQINNLLDNEEGLSASEIRHVAELIGNMISDEITDIQKEPDLVSIHYPNLKLKKDKNGKEFDFTTASRKQIIKTIGIANLMERAKFVFSPQKAHYNDRRIMRKAFLVMNNWDALMYLASDIFVFNEGLGIAKDFTTGDFIITEGSKIDFDNLNDWSSDPEAIAENFKDEQEHWQIESRTLDVLNHMSAIVKQGLHNCYILDKNYNRIVNDWKCYERVNPRTAVNSILRWTQGSTSLSDMIEKLKAKQKANPWVSQLIKRLSDTTGNESDFQSQFYSTMTKSFQLYSIVKSDNGKYYSMAVNEHPALSDIIRTISAKYDIQTLPLFNPNPVGKSLGIKGEINIEKYNTLVEANKTLNALLSKIPSTEDIPEDIAESIGEVFKNVCSVFDMSLSDEMIGATMDKDILMKMGLQLKFLINKDLTPEFNNQRNGKSKEYKPFDVSAKHSIRGDIMKFLKPFMEPLEDSAVNAFFDSGKMYQSYVTPSYMTRLINNFHLENKEDFKAFIEKNYGKSEWFRDTSTSDITEGWKNMWLDYLVNNNTEIIAHKVELNFNGHNYMRNLNDAEYTLSLIAEYFSESTSSSKDRSPSWYRIPMQSNKPSSEFIRFISYRGIGYKEDIVSGLHEMFSQELSRIQTVLNRNMSKTDDAFIKNFDTNGRKFCFLPVMNLYLENTKAAKAQRTYIRDKEGNILTNLNNKFARLLQEKIKGEKKLTDEDETFLGMYAEEILRNSMEERVQSILDDWDRKGIIDAAATSIKDIYPKQLEGNDKKAKEDQKKSTRKQIENFLWNDAFASKNILQLTITDIAFYKDTEDLQKRLAQLHAPGNRGNINAIDYKGNKVSDGNYRTIILKDFDSFVTNIIDNLNEVFDRRIAEAREANNEAQAKSYEVLKDNLTRPRTYNEDGSIKDKGGKYWNINVTDAQGYSSPSSYRKKAFMFGKWSRDAESIYNKLLKGETNYTDLETAFQPLKPFVYAKLDKNIGIPGKDPITNIPVPFQAKNAEYLLIMADAIISKEKNLSRPNLLRAVFRIMEESERLNPTKGIDTVQFESAIKSGLQGVIDINPFLEEVNGEELAYNFIKNKIYNEEYSDKDKKNRVYRTYNSDVFVHTTSYDNYCLQQEVPEHFKNHSQAHGSQIRAITPADLDYYTYDANGKQIVNTYSWQESNAEGKLVTRKANANEFQEEFEHTIALNIDASISKLKKELFLNVDGLDPSDIKKQQNIAIAKILQREIVSSPRYGIDLLQACSVDKRTEEFRIPKGDPIQAKRIEQLLNSIIKNRINKQEISGGPIVQVSNFGTSKQLHIRFNDRKGNLLPSEEEYDASKHDNLPYKEYIKKNQGGIAYFEVFIPMWTNDVFKKFTNPDGTINIEAIEATDPELLKMVSYRIPTEDKYSCAPMKAVGFLPKEAGSAIMFPYELTEIDDSDFDVDKRYVMRKNLPIYTKNYTDFKDELIIKGKQLYKKILHEEPAYNYVERIVGEVIDKGENFNASSSFRKVLYSEYQKLAYYTKLPEIGTTNFNNNKIVDMTFAVLTNVMTADKILNPGGFDGPKKMGYTVAAYKNLALKGKTPTWESLEAMSIDELKDLSYTFKDLTFADTQVQFYKQNAAAASLIGVFAVNKVAHALLSKDRMYLDLESIGCPTNFNIAGFTFTKRMLLDPTFDSEGNLIGKTLGSLVSASADAVKDPVLNLMNINMTTAGMLNAMLRLGMTFNDAALFLSQSTIESLLNEFNRENLNNYVSLNNIIEKKITRYKQILKLSDDELTQEALTKEELIKGLVPMEFPVNITDTSELSPEIQERLKLECKVLLNFKRIQAITEAVRNPTYLTRFNSISNAVGPLIVDNLIMRHKMNKFLGTTKDPTGFYKDDTSNKTVDIKDIFMNHPMLAKFAETVDIADMLFNDMPAGSRGFRAVLNALPSSIADKMYSDKKLLDSFANFYQSYIAIVTGLIDPHKLPNLINTFPKDFVENKVKERYPDNALIQAIQLRTNKLTQKAYLTLNITGADETAKEVLRSAWIDLHKINPELSQKLFEYSFFVAGMGFSPKTFMSVLPTYVKERLKGDNGASYIDTYRHLPDTEAYKDLIIDQFIRNNWDNNKLVPWRGKDAKSYAIIDGGLLRITDLTEREEVRDLDYMKTKVKKQVYLWKKKYSDKDVTVFEPLTPLGNNKEYLEMSTENIKNSYQDTTTIEDDVTANPVESSTDLPSNSNQQTDVEAPVRTSDNWLRKQLLLFNEAYYTDDNHYKNFVTYVTNVGEELKTNTMNFIANKLSEKGITIDNEEFKKKFNDELSKYCK